MTVAVLAHQPAIASILVAHGYRPDLVESAWLGDWERLAELAAANPAGVDQLHPLGGTSMHAGVRGGHGSEVWRVYAEGASPNPSRPHDVPSPLRATFELPDLALVEQTAAVLLGNGADPRGPEPGGDTALHQAAARGSTTLVELLLRKGADPQATDDHGRRPIDVATPAAGVVDMLEGRIVVARDSTRYRRAFDVDGNSYRPEPLTGVSSAEQRSFVGMGHGHFDGLRARLDADPRLVHAASSSTEMAIDAAGHVGRRDIVDHLLERGAPLSMVSAVLQGQTERVGALLDAHPERVHERGPHDFALLWYCAIGSGGAPMAELLIDRGAEVEAQHYLGTTALHFAVLAGQPDLAVLLLERGANVDRSGRKFDLAGDTPVALARARGDERMVSLLEARGASVDRS